MFEQTLSRIVEINYLNAYILDSFGIEFFKYPESSLEDVCKRLRLNPERIISCLQNPFLPESATETAHLEKYGVTELVRMLKSTHRQFIRRQLPFMNKLIGGISLREVRCDYRDTVEILQMGFHWFAEDLIRHILFEERKVFDRLVSLEYGLYDKNYLHICSYRLKNISVEEMSRRHADDDEMKPIRDMTENYQIRPDMPLIIKVLYEEFKRFDKDLHRHCEIENNYLFPKGIVLEKKVNELIAKISHLN
jgi:regulator of cell morphogenesis and NO signaling